jgi:hypothetical protein
MSDAPPDLRALARRYLDLWQEQVSAMAADPALAEALANGISLMTRAAGAFADAAPTTDAGSEAGHGAAQPDGTPLSSPPGSAPAAAAPAGARLDPDGLAGRVAVLEERVAALEAALGRRGGGTAATPRRRRT